jgi:L-asparagine transporter-like permease
MATHIRFRKRQGCPPDGKCQMWGYPYTSLFVLISLIAAIISMPFVKGQTSGLVAGCVIVAFFTAVYALAHHFNRDKKPNRADIYERDARLSAELSEELTDIKREEDENRHEP